MLTFVIPVRHHLSTDDWPSVQDRMRETLASIAAQTVEAWECLVVANDDTPLPALPARCSVVPVPFPPALLPDVRDVGQEARDEAIRADKGHRVLAGLLAARPSGHVMVVDYDDLVSRRIAALVAAQPEANGWYVDSGFMYTGGRTVYRVRSGFNGLCGTSLVVRADLLGMPEPGTPADEPCTGSGTGAAPAGRRPCVVCSSESECSSPSPGGPCGACYACVPASSCAGSSSAAGRGGRTHPRRASGSPAAR